MSLHDFVSTFSNEKPAIRRRMATVKSIQSDYTVTVTLNGTDVAGVRYFGHYVPVAGSQVWLDTDGGDLIAVGSLAGRGGRALGAYIYKNADQSIANNTLTKITFASVDFDAEAMFDNANDTLVLNRAGLWTVAAGASFDANAAGYREISIRGTGLLSGDIVSQRVPATPTTNTRLTTSSTGYFGYGDTVALWARQTSGAALLVDGTAYASTWLSAIYLGAGA